MESVCARLCLLTRAAWQDNLPSPFTRSSVRNLIRLGALEGLTLRKVSGVKEESYVRAEALLSRSKEIYEAVEDCRSRGYSVILPEDEEWPVNLFALGRNMPQFLFLCGNLALFSRRAVSIAGSRDIEAGTAAVAERIGKELALSEYVMISGGARGVDTQAQKACLAEGGCLILVPAYPCDEFLRQDYLQDALKDNRLLIVSDTWPDESFSAQKALTRNHTIYALGDAAVVAAARDGVGGTWKGASACLRGGYTPLFCVNAYGSDFNGNQKLLKLGANPLDMTMPIGRQLFAEGM